ncbi:MAG TPA: PA domain-containing protein [Janthinobacterium sp.]|nr:PA domain-containing protein [Janthinobacterium sp.]
MKTMNFSGFKRIAAMLVLSSLALAPAHAATITIVNANAPGEGFNDPTPAAPVGGNPGTTLGQQRLIAFTYAADIWGSKLSSDVPIRIQAAFTPLACNATGAVLGSAGAREVFADFPGAPKQNTWYPSALAEKISGAELSTPGEPDIGANFNSRLGLAPDCLPGTPFYLGLDNNFGTGIDFVTVLLHEMAHGLGFQTYTDRSSGDFFLGVPSVWDYFLLDNRINQVWVNLTAAQRVASAVSGNGLSWDGPRVTAAVPEVLDPVSRLVISGPAAGDAARDYAVGDVSFGPPLANPPVSGQVMPVVDQAGGTGLACDPLDAVNATAVRNNIALVDRGVCAYVVKARNVQDAGAKGMIVVDNAPGDPTGLSGPDPSITIPSIRVSQDDGNLIRSSLQRRSRTASGVVAALGVDPLRLAGTDAQRHILMYTPIVEEPGSSVSHYTTAAKPNQLMEPAINVDLIHEVEPPRDLTLPLLRDIGW